MNAIIYGGCAAEFVGCVFHENFIVAREKLTLTPTNVSL